MPFFIGLCREVDGMKQKDTRRKTRSRYTVVVRGTEGRTRVEVLAGLLWRRRREER